MKFWPVVLFALFLVACGGSESPSVDEALTDAAADAPQADTLTTATTTQRSSGIGEGSRGTPQASIDNLPGDGVSEDFISVGDETVGFARTRETSAERPASEAPATIETPAEGQADETLATVEPSAASETPAKAEPSAASETPAKAEPSAASETPASSTGAESAPKQDSPSTTAAPKAPPPTTAKASTTGGYKTVRDPMSAAMPVYNRPYNAKMGSWGGPKPPSGNSQWLKVPVTKGTQTGVGVKNKLFDGTEGWVSFNIRMVNWEQSEYSTKLPGIGAELTRGASGPKDFPKTIGGQGGGAAGGITGGPDGAGKAWSARMFVGGVKLPAKASASAKGQLGYEIYHRDSPNIAGDGRIFGETVRWDANIRDEKWHNIKHYVKLNDIRQSNGVIRSYYDGKLVYERTGLSLVDNPKYRTVALFLNVFHGGSIPAAADFEVHIDDIRYNAGRVDKTG